MSFPNSAQGLGSRTQVRIASQADFRHVPSATTFRDYRTNFGDISPEVSSIEQQKILAGGAPSTPLEGKGIYGIVTEQIGDVDPNCYGFMHHLANLFGNYELTNNGTWMKHVYGLNASVAANRYLVKLIDDDHAPRIRQVGCRVGAFELSVEPNSNLSASFEYGVSSFDTFGPVSQEAGSGSDMPTFGGVWGDWNAEGSAIEDLDVEITTKSDSDLTLKVKNAADGAYGSTTVAYTLGDNPVRLFFSDGSGPVGTRANPVTFFAPAAATVVQGDEFQVQSRRARWSASYPTQRSISSVQSIFVLDDQEVKVEGGYTLRVFWDSPGVEFKPDIAQRQGGTVAKAGVLRATVDLNREITDLLYQHRLWDQSSVSLVIDAQTDDTITTGQPFLFKGMLPALRPSGQMFTPGAGGQNTSEGLTLTAGVPASSYTYGGDTTSEHVALVLHNALSAY